MLRHAAVALVLSCCVLAACGDDVAVDADGDVVLEPGAGCGDAFFWAANDDESVAVTVAVEQRKRSRTEATTASYDVGDAGLTVTVVRGHDLSQAFCTDLLVGDPVKSEEDASAGHVTVVLDPQTPDLQGCGSTSGTVTVSALEGDGLSFADFTVQSADIGCYAG